MDGEIFLDLKELTFHDPDLDDDGPELVVFGKNIQLRISGTKDGWEWVSQWAHRCAEAQV